jgi:hypothetical protein
MNVQKASMKSSIKYTKSLAAAATKVYKTHENEEDAACITLNTEEARLYKIFKEFLYLRHTTVRLKSSDGDIMTPKSLSFDTIGYIEENLSRLLNSIIKINKSRIDNYPISAYATFHQWSIVYASARKNGLARTILSSIEDHMMQALNTMIAANK